MKPDGDLRDLLERVRRGVLSPDEAENEIQKRGTGHIGSIAHLDLERAGRCGIPEVVLAEGKDPSHLYAIAEGYARRAGRCVITRIDPDTLPALQEITERLGISYEYSPEGRIMVLTGAPKISKTGGVIGVITAGTSDIRVAEEARVIAEEMGCIVRTSYDVGVAGLHRLFPVLEKMRDCHAFVVAAGREGTLPAVVAGLMDQPVIGVPVSTGYGYMGKGEAALASMLQSCSVLTVVNIDAGFVAGAFAARIATMVAGGRS
ncbi:MAG TPA: nickel pincer cofactor biosynthesis protein LarB [Methanospirillum sp.]|uniref:nickel pincer cofactor biosynthesis protein LarB n=1 Tax=Methanospirillum sp. TaxID=45200 RepID=UPI002BEB333D|nr:nickel pincer cofactor biosynthesis protein LarB [Methanospirillum sp.]HWQ64545.1 nickel pincer cofactor biosynthesis protein LarB [Methanospirillum sp.]